MERRGRSRRRNGGGCMVVQYSYTPRRFVSRWLFGSKGTKENREEEVNEEEEDIEEAGGSYEATPTRCSTKCLMESSPSNPAPSTETSESQNREASLDMAMGSFLLYLVVASKIELDKMMKLRIQMETLLQSVKEEALKKELQEMPPNDNNHFSPQVISNLASSIFDQTSTSIVQEDYTEYEVSKPDHEPKLESKLRSLCLNKAGERQSRIEDNERNVMVSEEVQEDDRNGVCPYQLERKLHELLETRLREEILELETALRRVKRRLDEKEAEVSWWKDAAALLSMRLPESSRAELKCCVPESRGTQPEPERAVPESSRTSLKRRISLSR